MKYLIIYFLINSSILWGIYCNDKQILKEHNFSVILVFYCVAFPLTVIREIYLSNFFQNNIRFWILLHFTDLMSGKSDEELKYIFEDKSFEDFRKSKQFMEMCIKYDYKNPASACDVCDRTSKEKENCKSTMCQ